MFNVSAQAQVFGVLLMSMLIVICTVIIATRGYIGILYALSTIVASIPFILTGVYMMDCLSYGSCDMFAWIIVIFIFMIFTMVLIWVSIIYFESHSLMSNERQRNKQISSNSLYDDNMSPSSSPQPASSTPQPASPTPQPASPTPQPASSTPQPASSTPQPASSTPQPAPASQSSTGSV